MFGHSHVGILSRLAKPTEHRSSVEKQSTSDTISLFLSIVGPVCGCQYNKSPAMSI